MLVRFYRLSNWLYRHRIPILPKLIYYISYCLFNSSVPATCTIGKGTRFAYGGIAVVIHARAVIGKNCVIGQCSTIGGRSKHKKVPIIGDNVYMGAGSKILGPVSVGDNVVIGAGAIVLSDVPNNCIVVGAPARIIKSHIVPKDFV